MVNPRRPSRHGERGQTVEYVLILVLIGGGLLVALGLMVRSTKRMYAGTSSAIALPASYPAHDGGVAMSRSGAPDGSPAASSDSAGSAESSDSMAQSPDATDSPDPLNVAGAN
jgi:hypothetical protein